MLRLSSIVIVVLRLFCLQWVIQGFGYMITIPTTFGRDPASIFLLRCLPTFVMLLFAVCVWWLAPILAGLITRKQDVDVTVPSLSLVDLYAFGFLFLGLYFVLSYLAPAANWFWYFLSVAATRSDYDPERRSSSYEMASQVIPLLAGFASMLNARRLARKLAEHDKKNEGVASPESDSSKN